MAEPTRRNVLDAAAGLIAAGTAPASLAQAAHPDAGLLAAYESFRVFEREFNCSPRAGTMTEEEREAEYGRLSRLREVVGEIPARTPAGFALKALVLLRDKTDVAWSLAAFTAWDGYSVAPGGEEDWDAAFLWRIVEQAGPELDELRRRAGILA